MSDSITKWHEMHGDDSYIYESPDKGETVTRRAFGTSVQEREVIKQPVISEGHLKLAYQILIDYPKESILEAARIIRVG